MTEAATMTMTQAPERRLPVRAVRIPRYWAFLSYSHDDKMWADWLHRELETYRVPPKLVGRDTGSGPIPARLTPIFRDRDELPAATDLGDKIEDALAASRFLIVLCSPTAATSHWANQEILQFKRIHPDGSILAVIVAGEPNASDVPGRGADECFPPALRYELDADGELTSARAEPIAADAREEGDGKKLAKLKLVAGMLGIGLDELVEREAQRRQRRLAIVAAASMVGMVVTSGLAVVAVQSRNEAQEQRAQAEGLIGFMLGDLRGKLEPVGKLDVLDSVGERALGYYRTQDKARLTEEGLAQRSKALTLIGEIAQRRGDLDGALMRYLEALAGTAETLKRFPDDPQRAFDHAQNVFWVGYIAWERRQIGAARRRFSEYKALAGRMIALDPSNPKWRLESVYADTNLGTLLLEEKQYRAAVRAFLGAVAEAERLSAGQPLDAVFQVQVIDGLAWLADAQEGAGRMQESLHSRQRQIEMIGQVARSNGDTPSLKSKAAVAHKMVGRLQVWLGRGEQGVASLRRAAALSDALRQIEPSNAEWQSYSASIYHNLGTALIETGDRAAAIKAGGTSCALAAQLVARDASAVEPRVTHLGNCASLRARTSVDPATGLAAAREAIAIGRHGGSAGRTAGRELRVRAGLMGGERLVALARPQEANAMWSSAMALVEQTGDTHPNLHVLRLGLLKRLGRAPESDALSRRLADMGYRSPSFLRDYVNPAAATTPRRRNS